MKGIIALVLAAGATIAVAAPTPADAAQGCGRGFHRGAYGRCLPNRGHRAVVVAPGLVVGRFYRGHGYWDGHRYWHRRYRWHGGWRYR